MKIKVIWIIDSLGPGGAERLTLSILEKFDRSKFDLRVCVLQVRLGNPVAVELEKLGIPIDFVPIPNLRHPTNLPVLIRYLRAQQPQLVHVQLEFSNVLGIVAAKLLGIPSVSTLHTLDNPEEGTAFWRSQLMWFVLRYFCDRVIAVSESTRQHHMRFGKIQSDKIVTIYNGIDLAAYRDLERCAFEEKRKSLHLSTNTVVLVTVAVLRELKGIQYMIEAMRILVEQVHNLQYLVVGDGQYRATLKALVESKGLTKSVIFAGQRSDINEILAVSDLFVLPTLTEALPTVLMEAMAAKKAIVASKVGGVPEMITDGFNGLLIPPADPSALAAACSKLVQDKTTRDTMALAGAQISRERFDIKKQINTIESLYYSLLNSE